MIEQYIKDFLHYTIDSTAEDAAGKWRPRFMVIDLLNKRISTRVFFDELFELKAEAETYGHHAAIQWIDNGCSQLDK